MKSIIPLFFAALILFSCRVNSQLTLSSDGSGNMENEIILKPFFQEFFFDIFDKQALFFEIESGLDIHPGIDQSLMVESEESINNQFSFLDIKNLPGISEGILQVTEQGDSTLLQITINRENWSQLETLFPLLGDPSISYLGPQGSEGLERSEFKEMLIYPFEGYAPSWDAAEAALNLSEINLTVQIDGEVLSVENGRTTGDNKVEFILPLFDLLMLDRELSYSLIYR